MTSTSFDFDYKVNNSDVSSINKHLLNCDKLFKPPLSSYVNIQEYSKKLFTLASNFEAWHDDKLIGLVSVYLNDLKNEVSYISNVSIEAEYQKHGIASALLIKAITTAVELGFLCVKLEVYRENFKAVSLYKKLGLEEEILDGEKLVMVKYYQPL